MTTTPVPNPLAVFGNRKTEAQTSLTAVVEPTGPSKIVRPGVVATEHDGVVKAKHLKSGQKVRAYLQGAPRGGERVVGTVTRLGDGAMVRIEWASGQPTSEYKAAYRWHDASLEGQSISKPALVNYQEV